MSRATQRVRRLRDGPYKVVLHPGSEGAAATITIAQRREQGFTVTFGQLYTILGLRAAEALRAERKSKRSNR